jgi:hypothetical protein
MWLDRLQALVQGQVWQGRQENEVRVNERLLAQLVSQGFDRFARDCFNLYFAMLYSINISTAIGIYINHFDIFLHLILHVLMFADWQLTRHFKRPKTMIFLRS